MTRDEKRRGAARDDPYAWIDEVGALLSEAAIHGCETACVPIDDLRALVRVARNAVAVDLALDGSGIAPINLRLALRREGSPR